MVNLVAQGTIEEGMLSVLAFKKSLFAGVLDGGESGVFLQGTRLSELMKAVEEVTGAMGAAESAESNPAEREPASSDDVQVVAAPPDPWAPLVDAGLTLLQALTLRDADGLGSLGAWIERDPQSGCDMLRVPLQQPQPQTIQRLDKALGGLLAGLG